MKRLGKALFGLLLPAMLLAQSDRGTITGTVADPATAVVPNAVLVGTHRETGAVYQTVSTQTGNFTLASLPAGIYDVTIEAPGFKKYSRTGIQVQVAQVVRLD